MFKKIDIKYLCYFCLPFFWIYPAFRNDYGLEELILNFAFILTAVILYKVKNKAVVFFSLVAISVVASVYSQDYLFEAVQALLLMCTYKYAKDEDELYKKEKNYDMSNLYLTLNYIMSVVQIIYCVNNIDKMTMIPSYKNDTFKIMVWFYVFLVYFLVRLIRKKKKNKKQLTKILMGTYVSALVGITTSTVYFCLEYGVYLQSLLRVHMLYWFVFVLSILMREEVAKWRR